MPSSRGEIENAHSLDRCRIGNLHPANHRASVGLHKLTNRDHRGMTDHGERIALPARLDPQHAEAALGIIKCDRSAIPAKTSDSAETQFCRRISLGSVGI
jgi:hypothetical protein